MKPEPAGNSRRFLILDFWENDFNRAPNPEQAQSLPVLVSLFNTRLALMERTLDDQPSPEAQRTIADLRAMVARIPTDSLLVKRVYPEVEEAWRESWWFYLNASKLEFLLLKVGPLLRYAPDVDVAATTFTHKVERLKLDLTGFRKPVRSGGNHDQPDPPRTGQVLPRLQPRQ